MCVRPLHIANPGYSPNNLYTPPFIDVPCGKCWQCKLTRQNDFAFRVLNDMLSRNCVPFFVTLTYNDEYLPILSYYQTIKSDFNLPVRDIDSLSVWNKKHVQRFNKVLRRQIHYYYGVASDSFKYLCSCERGSDDVYIDYKGRKRKATSRPHYHLLYLLYLPQLPLPCRKLPLQFYDYCRLNTLDSNFISFFKWLLHSRWFYGNVDDISYCRDIVSATKYITKYITKDFNEKLYSVSPSSIVSIFDKYYNDELQRQELDFVFGCKVKFIPPIKLSDLLPRSFSSINLGMSFVDNLSYDELLDYASGVKKVCLPSQRNSSMIMLPIYYIRKFTRQIIRKRPYSFSQRYVYNGSGFVFECKPNTSISTPRDCWDNQNGYYTVSNPPSYSETVVTDFGKRVMRSRLVHSYRRIRAAFGNYITNRSYFKNCIEGFASIMPNHYLLSFKDIDISSSLFSDGFFGKYINYYHSLNKDVSLLDFLNYSKLCSTAEMSLKHFAFERCYKQKVASVAFNNPDLFLNHYV